MYISSIFSYIVFAYGSSALLAARFHNSRVFCIHSYCSNTCRLAEKSSAVTIKRGKMAPEFMFFAT